MLLGLMARLELLLRWIGDTPFKYTAQGGELRYSDKLWVTKDGQQQI
jgi:hypothetical protein